MHGMQRIELAPLRPRHAVRLPVASSRSTAGSQLKDRNGKCGALSMGMEASGLDRQLKCHLDTFLLARGKRARSPGLWRVEYLLSNHSSKSITAAT